STAEERAVGHELAHQATGAQVEDPYVRTAPRSRRRHHIGHSGGDHIADGNAYTTEEPWIIGVEVLHNGLTQAVNHADFRPAPEIGAKSQPRRLNAWHIVFRDRYDRAGSTP